MKLHELKTVDPFFGMLGPDKKNFEIRFNDRKIERNDILVLSHWIGATEFSGSSVLCKVISRIPISTVPNFVLPEGPRITYDPRLWEVFGLQFIPTGDPIFGDKYVWKRSAALKQAHGLVK